MNDFTKEELQCILDWSYELGMEYGNDGDELERIIVNKIQSMIENYCTHDSKENMGGFCWKCIKCGMKFGDETQ